MKKILAWMVIITLTASPSFGFGGFGPGGGGAALPGGCNDGEMLTYTAATGTWGCGEGTGTGDVTGAGDCASGACGDGTSDGGTYYRFYDGASAYLALTAGVRTVTFGPSNANAENLLITFGDNNNTVAISSSTGGVVSINGSAATLTTPRLIGDANFDGSAPITADAILDSVDLSPTSGTWDLSELGALVVPSFTTSQGATGGGYNILEGSGNGTNYIRTSVPDAITTSSDLRHANTIPTMNQFQLYPAPTGIISTYVWTTYGEFGVLNLVTTGSMSAAIPSVADADAHSVTGAEAYGYMGWATGAGTWTLLAAGAGMNLCIYSTTAAAIIINPDDADVIHLNGTALSAGDSITSASGAGDFICVVARDATNWHTLGRSGTWTDSN